ncbi:NUDIX hydrolase [Streptomyces sp. DT24]|uniref:NUDIX hydrolase n=1 Tax=unclassified Streptomyces TaxID=2593676 RepID=UPI003CFB9F4B
MEKWKRSEPTTVHKVGWREVVTKTYLMPNGQRAAFDTFGPEGQQFVAVIGLTLSKKVIIARQFRVGPEKVMDELPGGFVDEGEGLEIAARREFQEETGYAAGAVTYLGGYNKDTYMNGIWHVYLATDCTSNGEQELEDEEHIEIVLITIKELISNAKSNKMTDAIAVLKAYDHLQELDQ